MARIYSSILLLALVSCDRRAISPASDSGPLDKAPPMDSAPLPDTRLRPDSRPGCPPGEFSLTTDRPEYTLAEAQQVTLTFCNGTRFQVFVSSCNPFLRQNLKDEKWTEEQGRECETDHGQPLPPGETVMETSFFSPGFWRVHLTGVVQCDQEGCPVVDVLSPVALVRAESSPSDCASAQSCPISAAGPVLECLAPGSCMPSGIALPRRCETDADCRSGQDLVCGETCHGGSDCIPRCRADSDCRESEACGADGHCTARACTTAADCPLNFTCSKTGRCDRATCSQSAECRGYCVEGRCYELPGRCVECCPP